MFVKILNSPAVVPGPKANASEPALLQIIREAAESTAPSAVSVAEV